MSTAPAWPNSSSGRSCRGRPRTGWRRRWRSTGCWSATRRAAGGPGPRLGELANAAPDVLLTAAEPLLAALRDATGESAQLYLRRADERICVAAAERASGLRDTVPVGSVLPMTAGSAAQILLAWEPPEAVMPLLPRCKFTGRTLAEVRRRGWAQSVAEREAGVASVSAPIRDRTGRVIAAISVSGPIERLGRRPGDRHAMAVVRAGQRLSGL